ncbi:hypothetical protein OUZ56_030913 [Daphnia magna]|uniref:Uncharacterized protein n=1 Tax=Daphnia magna TaxID=35525 RepID=A0ABQ9ZSN9_9CRUS|nr:hypothetical protein OUZ56_030913 [Daphnia magna]
MVSTGTRRRINHVTAVSPGTNQRDKDEKEVRRKGRHYFFDNFFPHWIYRRVIAGAARTSTLYLPFFLFGFRLDWTTKTKLDKRFLLKSSVTSNHLYAIRRDSPNKNKLLELRDYIVAKSFLHLSHPPWDTRNDNENQLQKNAGTCGISIEYFVSYGARVQQTSLIFVKIHRPGICIAEH